MAAPSAVNQQPWEFYVVTDKAVLEKLAAASPYAAMTAKAPAAIVLCSRTENILVPELVDVDMATENILLEIEALGLGGVTQKQTQKKCAVTLHSAFVIRETYRNMYLRSVTYSLSPYDTYC